MAFLMAADLLEWLMADCSSREFWQDANDDASFGETTLTMPRVGLPVSGKGRSEFLDP